MSTATPTGPIEPRPIHGGLAASALRLEAERLRRSRARLLGRHPSMRRMAELEACLRQRAVEARAASRAEESGR